MTSTTTLAAVSGSTRATPAGVSSTRYRAATPAFDVIARHGARPKNTADSALDPGAADQLLLFVQTQLAAQTGFATCALSCCTSLAASMKASRVSISWRRGNRLRLIASTDGASETIATAQRQKIEAAMNEAADQQCLVCSAGLPEQQHIEIAQRALARDGLVYCVPLAIDHQAVGAICVEYSREALPFAEQYKALTPTLLNRLSNQVSRRLWLEKQQQRSPWAVALDRLSKTKNSRRHHRWFKVWVGLAIVASIALLVPFEQSIVSPARIEGAVQRQLSAPVKGYLKTVLVRPGDSVKATQILATLGKRDLELEREQSQSEMQGFLAQRTTAMAKGDRSALAIAQSKINETRSRIEHIELRLEHTVVRAPFDAVVLDGDHWQSIGSPVDRGETLFTVVPNSAYRVVLEVDEADIAAINNGQLGALKLSSMPWQSLSFSVSRIAPMAKIINGRNSFEVYAELLESHDNVRPGLRGATHLPGKTQNLFTRWGARMTDAVSRLWWRWRPW